MVLVIDAMMITSILLVLFSTIIIYRLLRGPTMQDRVVALNVLGTNAVIIIALISVVTNNMGLLDIALIYALLNFLMSIAISKFTVERGGVL